MLCYPALDALQHLSINDEEAFLSLSSQSVPAVFREHKCRLSSPQLSKFFNFSFFPLLHDRRIRFFFFKKTFKLPMTAPCYENHKLHGVKPADRSKNLYYSITYIGTLLFPHNMPRDNINRHSCSGKKYFTYSYKNISQTSSFSDQV